jgi:hypothetical protein
MEDNLTNFGAAASDMESEPSPRPKGAISYVNHPLTSSEIAWLRQQMRRASEASRQLALAEGKPDSP